MGGMPSACLIWLQPGGPLPFSHSHPSFLSGGCHPFWKVQEVNEAKAQHHRDGFWEEWNLSLACFGGVGMAPLLTEPSDSAYPPPLVQSPALRSSREMLEGPLTGSPFSTVAGPA